MGDGPDARPQRAPLRSRLVASKDLGVTAWVFVYGTLKQGFENHHLVSLLRSSFWKAGQCLLDRSPDQLVQVLAVIVQFHNLSTGCEFRIR